MSKGAMEEESLVKRELDSKSERKKFPLTKEWMEKSIMSN